MSTALPAPSASALVTEWSWQPLAILLAVALSWWYLRAARRVSARGIAWPARRYALFALGIAMLVWTSCGFLQAYVGSLYWTWTSQVLTLWLGVPGVLLAAAPVQLALAEGGPTGRLSKFIHSPFARFFTNPLVGPALVPILSAGLFFGPLPAWAVATPPLEWALHLALLLVGALMLLPLVGLDKGVSALAVALTLAIGSVELVLDAVPGIVLRLKTDLVTSYFDHRATHSWSPAPLHDQQLAGAILWAVAEVIDLPFLLLVFRRWLQADARDAAAVDAVLAAEHAARAGMDGPAESDGGGHGDADVPWWVTDPTMQERFRRQV